jgi:hypothetical protein
VHFKIVYISSLLVRRLCCVALLLALVTPSAALGELAQVAPEASPTAEASGRANTKEKSVIRFASLVQFVSETVERLDFQRVRSKLEFKSAIYEGERFSLGESAVLKFITRGECVGVIYGAGQGLAPEMEKTWRIRSQAARWICPKGASDTVVLHETRFTIGGPDGGELFIDGDRMLVLSGRVDAGKGELPRLTLLTASSSGSGGGSGAGKNIAWLRENPEPLPSAAWRFNQKRKAPAESLVFDRPIDPPPPKAEPKTTRWIFGPTGGGGSLNFDKGALDRKALSTDGARLQLQKKRGSGSWIAFLEYVSTEDKSSSCGFNTPCPEVNAHGNFLNAQVGYRFNHDRWWSQFLRVGGGINKTRINIKTQNGTTSYNSDVEYEFYMLSVAYGVDAYYSPSWFSRGGLYAGIDIDAARSLARGKKNVSGEYLNGSTARPSIADEPTTLTTFNLQLMLGLMFLY